MSAIAEVNLWLQESCDKHMAAVLTHFGFNDNARESDAYGARVTYFKNKLAIRVQFESCDPSIIMWLIRCHNHEIPVYRDHPDDYLPIATFLQLHGVQIVCVPEVARHLFNRKEVDDCIRSYAVALSRFGSPILRGDVDTWHEVQQQIQHRNNS